MARKAFTLVELLVVIGIMANKIIAVLRHPPRASTLRQHGSFEVGRMSWTDAARACVQVYEEARGAMNPGGR